MRFAERCAADDAGRAKAAAGVRKRILDGEVDVVRLAFADQHGVLRGKTLVGAAAADALDDGWAITSSLLAKDTAHRTVFPIWQDTDDPVLGRLRGARDMMMVPDPATFRVLPWSPRSGWMLCDLSNRDGAPVPFSTRQLYRGVLRKLEAAGYAFVVGLEIELHLFRLEDENLGLAHSGQPGDPPTVSLLTHGYQYLTETRYDHLDAILDVIRASAQQLDLPLRSMELEYGPSQCELTFAPREGLEPADMMVLFRSAVKQICRRHGYHATFMCRPRIPNVMSSGWHLHQSLRDRRTGGNAFASPPGSPELLSPLGWQYLGGLLANAGASAAFATPTINGYRRYRPNSLAPDHATWGVDNRGVMLRVVGEPNSPATHIENRLGEPAANPYLYMASQVVAGLYGIEHACEPGPEAGSPYQTDAPRLPTTLDDALAALDNDRCFRAAFGDLFVDYFLQIKRAEIARFRLEVTEWEQREYFEIF